MACVQIPDLPLEQFGKEKVQKWLQERVPLSGSMELDLRCNLRCLHCYRDGDWLSDILNTDEVKSVLDQVAAAGTIWMLSPAARSSCGRTSSRSTTTLGGWV